MAETKPSAMQQIIEALRELTDVAEQCDSWQSFPSTPLEKARAALSAARAMQEQQAGVTMENYRAMLAASPSAPPVAGDSVQQPAGEAPRPYGWAVHGQLYGDETAAKDIARNVFGDESMATAVFTAAPIQQAAQPEAVPSTVSKTGLKKRADAVVADVLLLADHYAHERVRNLGWQDEARKALANGIRAKLTTFAKTMPAPSNPEAQQAAKPVAAEPFKCSADGAPSLCQTCRPGGRCIASPTAPASAGAEAQQDAPCPEGWATQAMEALFAANAGSRVTLDMKRAAGIALQVMRGQRWDDSAQGWSGVAAPAGAQQDREPGYVDDLELRYAQIVEERDHLRAVISGEPLTEDDIKRMRSEARADPRCLDQHWFVLLVRAVERHYGIGSPSAKEDGQHG